MKEKTSAPGIFARVLPVLLAAAVLAGCAPDKEPIPPPIPEVGKVFSSDHTELAQIGRDAAIFHYAQFMGGDVPQYWHITKHEVLSSELRAGDEREFMVRVTSYLETDGAGFLIGQGIPNDSTDLNKGGVCPEVGREFRVKALGGGDYEIVSIGTGGGAQGLEPARVSYELIHLSKGQALNTVALEGDGERLARDIIANYMFKSSAWPGKDIDALEECFLIRAGYIDGSTSEYYAYPVDGMAVMQYGTDGRYSRVDDALYAELAKLAKRCPGPVDRTDLEACISDAVLTFNAGKFLEGNFAAQAHTVLATEESGDTVTVYLVAMYMEFSYEDGSFSDISGGQGPVVILFERNAAGEYGLKEYWAGHPKEMQERFPPGIWKDVLDGNYTEKHKRSCYEQAGAYFGTEPKEESP